MPASLFDLSTTTLLLLLGIMIFSGLIHGTLGLGFPMIATPLLSLMFDVRTAILLTLLPTVFVNIASITRESDWKNSLDRFWPLALYALGGSVVGSVLIVHSDPAPYKLVLALMIILFLATELIRGESIAWTQTHPALSMLGFGILGGLAAGTTNVMVPILIIYTLGMGLAPPAMVQVFNITFLGGKIAQIGVFGVEGLIDLPLVQTTVALGVASLAALFVGMRIRDHIPTGTFRSIIKALLVIIAITLIMQYIGLSIV